MIKRLTTFGWLGDDSGDRVPWITSNGWLYAAYRDPGISARHVFTMTPAPTFRMT